MMTIMLVMIVHGDKFNTSVFNDGLFYRLYHTASRWGKGRLLFKLLDPLTSLRYRVRIDLEQIKIKK